MSPVIERPSAATSHSANYLSPGIVEGSLRMAFSPLLALIASPHVIFVVVVVKPTASLRSSLDLVLSLVTKKFSSICILIVGDETGFQIGLSSA